MVTRNYRLGRRGEAAEETRRRIVEATRELHGELGVAATSMKMIAERAGVSVGTVYHHFPSYDDAIEACGQLTLSLSPPPDPAEIAAVDTLEARIGRLVAAIFGFYAGVLGYARVRADRDQFARIDAYVRQEEEHRRHLVRVALGASAAQDERVATIAAILDVGVYDSLLDQGLSHKRAVEEIHRVILASLEDA